ncbi:methyltransferase domain-containing protein [Amycolatopsis aidingensis]|uniref:methyltransferase domain-containing protein n=1 Tax=Amycolatopsis aidingensis TaxID=2842453 RepID=UPI001C0E56C6|nr:methyltransferase domain-containing protein [Amycolatopsis aidingensis]
MSSSASPTYSASWLRLREDADAQARAIGLVAALRPHLPGPPLLVRDLGCGTGSMGRWLAGWLPGPQRWILHDHDPGLLAAAAAAQPERAADGTPVDVRTEQGDLTELRATHLAGTSLVTASALLDLLTAEEVAGLAAACTGAGCAALLTLSVTGRVELTPPDPLDAELAAAFNDHQRRRMHGRRLLGPDAAEMAAAAFRHGGATVCRQPSPWRLGAAEAALAGEWLRGWVAAAVQQRPDLEPAATDYLHRRLRGCAEGALRVVVWHEDLLVLPAGG